MKKLQQIADTKGRIGLDKAILKAYAPSRASPLSISQKINRLTFQLKKLSQRVTDLTQQEQALAIRMEQLSEQIEDLEKSRNKKVVWEVSTVRSTTPWASVGKHGSP